jgi:hypothetical protein
MVIASRISSSVSFPRSISLMISSTFFIGLKEREMGDQTNRFCKHGGGHAQLAVNILERGCRLLNGSHRLRIQVRRFQGIDLHLNLQFHPSQSLQLRLALLLPPQGCQCRCRTVVVVFENDPGL